MFNTNLVFSVKISKEFTSSNNCLTGSPGKNLGFTLMELMVSMTIISMVVVVLYFAFSIGSRSWDKDDLRTGREVRLEAVLRLIQDDLLNAVPYEMNWEKGTISLFAGGPGSLFYVTGNGAGAVSGAGAGLFFTFLYVDECPETTEDCLFLYKTSRPSPEFVSSVDQFTSGSEFQRLHFSPGTEIANKSILIQDSLNDLNISYSSEAFIPFAGSGHEAPETYTLSNDVLPEDQWTAEKLPGQVRLVFSFEDREYVVHVPVGN
jgi:prepilin-type N-terminal cleavage/methylation domain-containing protein